MSVFFPIVSIWLQRAALGAALLLLLFSCAVPPRNLAIPLAETPLYSQRQWAIVNIPYTKVSRDLYAEQGSNLLGVVRFGNIVQVQRIERRQIDGSLWAYVSWDTASMQADGPQANSASSSAGTDSTTVQGWVQYSFLYAVENYPQAQLVSKQMRQENHLQH